jgi:hypothetical protein
MSLNQEGVGLAAPHIPIVTLDRNVLLCLQKREPGHERVSRLFQAHEAGQICIAVSAANRVEYKLQELKPQSNAEFLRELTELGLERPQILDYPLDWGMGLWENSIVSEDAYALELKIHEALFPQLPTYRSEDQPCSTQRRVTNAKCDVFALWGHIYSGGDYFVTEDRRFHRRNDRLLLLGARGIVTIDEALSALELISDRPR